VFTVEERHRVRRHVLAMAAEDPRVVAGAVVGSLANGGGDQWSDIDLTFAVSDAAAVGDVLTDWSSRLASELAAVELFDLPVGTTIYRVYLLPGSLQVDLSFTPAADFAPGGPRFELLFGEAGGLRPASEAEAGSERRYRRHLLGRGVHHAVRARFCVERGRRWQAEYWLSEVRDLALALACRERGLEDAYGRGFDDLPAEVLEPLDDALVRSLEREELLRALSCAAAGLLREAGDVAEPDVAELLREVVTGRATGR
jgi:hypothetical protein